MTMGKNILSALFFYVSWWSIVYNVINNRSLVVVVTVALFLLAYNLFIARFTSKSIINILGTALMGVAFDLGLNFFGIVKFNFEYFIWLPAVWLIFSTTMHFSFKRIFNFHRVFIFLLGAIGGPFSYWTAGQFAIVVYPYMYWEIFLHSLLWGVLFLCFKQIEEKNED